MKVILKQDVANVGVKNQVVEVSNGYAQNFLIARGLADIATPKKVAAAEKLAEARVAELEKAQEVLVEGLGKLKGKPLTINATANEKEHLFEALSADTIAAHLRDIVGVDVSADTIEIAEPIKELGEHTVHVVTGGNKTAVAIKVEGK